MTKSHSFNTLLAKVGTISIAAASVSVLVMSGQSAKAELVINNSRDTNDKAQMVVTDNSQNGLPPAQLGITPARINETVSLTQNKNLAKLNQSLTLYNYGSKAKVIKLNLVDIDESGKPIAPNESTLKPWTLINPTEFTIAPDGYQTVRMSIRLPVGFAPGAYSAMLTIEQQVDNSITYDSDGKGVTLELGSRYGLPIHLNVQ